MHGLPDRIRELGRRASHQRAHMLAYMTVFDITAIGVLDQCGSARRRRLPPCPLRAHLTVDIDGLRLAREHTQHIQRQDIGGSLPYAVDLCYKSRPMRDPV